MADLVLFLVLLAIGYLSGRGVERAHYRSIRQRETNLRDLPAIAVRRVPAEFSGHQTQLVAGSVVISVDYFKRFVAGLRYLVGGRVTSYESLIDRARREALLRMKESARGIHASHIFNVKMETSSISKGRRNTIGSIEVLAYGTAMISESQTANEARPALPEGKLLSYTGEKTGLIMDLLKFGGILLLALVIFLLFTAPRVADTSLDFEFYHYDTVTVGQRFMMDVYAENRTDDERYIAYLAIPDAVSQRFDYIISLADSNGEPQRQDGFTIYPTLIAVEPGTVWNGEFEFIAGTIGKWPLEIYLCDDNDVCTQLSAEITVTE